MADFAIDEDLGINGHVQFKDAAEAQKWVDIEKEF